MSIKYENLHSFKEGVILLHHSILETRRISHLHGSALFTIPLTSVEDNSYLFFYHIEFCYLLLFQLLIEAIRNNHSDMVIEARTQFAPLFYSFLHPKYQQLHLRDLWQRVQMPQEIKEYISTSESFSVSGREHSGQGGDFVHEELNKHIKALLPQIMPTAV